MIPLRNNASMAIKQIYNYISYLKNIGKQNKYQYHKLYYQNSVAEEVC